MIYIALFLLFAFLMAESVALIIIVAAIEPQVSVVIFVCLVLALFSVAHCLVDYCVCKQYYRFDNSKEIPLAVVVVFFW